jgi:NADH:ubiquinone reductase (H+-translocating)
MQQRIVVIGAGFAGTLSALSARRLIHLHRKDIPPAADIEVVVIAPEQQLVLRPRLYEPNPASKTVPLEELFNVTGVRFIRGTVDTIHVLDKSVELVDSAGARSTVSYDRLVLAAGSRLARPNIPGLQEYALSVDQLEEAVELEKRLQDLKSQPSTPARTTVIVCGAGFTGIELAAGLPARLRSILGPSSEIRVVLVGREHEVGATLGPGPRPAIARALTDLGVEMKLGQAVTSIDASGITTASGERIEGNTIVWTAGMAANLLNKQIPGGKDELGRLYVDRNLRLLSDSSVFVSGDTACAQTDDFGNIALMSCQHAQILGRVAGNNAAADLLGLTLTIYYQPSYVTCLDLGGHGAVLTNGWNRKVVSTGFLAKMVKRFINGSMIYPPAPSMFRAFGGANPALYAWLPTNFAQNGLTMLLSIVAFLRGLIS